MLSSSEVSHQSTECACCLQAAEEDNKKRKATGQAVSSPVGTTAARDKRRSPDPPEGCLLIPLADTPQQPLAAMPSMLHPGARALTRDAPSQAGRSGDIGQSHAADPAGASHAEQQPRSAAVAGAVERCASADAASQVQAGRALAEAACRTATQPRAEELGAEMPGICMLLHAL